MNVVSDSNHWMFISSNGGLTAGRKNNAYALFPYYTDDKISESSEHTGSKTIIRVQREEACELWEPFSERCSGLHSVHRNLYKNYHGNKILFEEVNETLGLLFRYEWNSSNLYGFVRKAELVNQSQHEYALSFIDGIQNILPYGVDPDLQLQASNLVDAYKRSELITESGLGIYALSAIIVDRAEPSEALKANVAWSTGLEDPQYLLSSLQLNNFRQGLAVQQETDIKGERGAYFVQQSARLSAGASMNWAIVANVNQTQSDIAALNYQILHSQNLHEALDENILEGTRKLNALVAGADGLRKTGDALKDARHFSNVLFNIMRGGTFDYNYSIEKRDFSNYLSNASKQVFERNRALIDRLDETFSSHALYQAIEGTHDQDLYRLCYEYLPLKFSRRHGDPSRPWNRFSINTHCEKTGRKILDYEGNWRDIFQNWEALAWSYPGFVQGMIFKFLNNSTFDGYNPYRITKSGFDWETIEPDNPWSYIGYWGDHQIIYLLKLLELFNRYNPQALRSLFDAPCFVYANVPYRIASYQAIARDPQNTISFDASLDRKIRDQVADSGADGALLANCTDPIHRVSFIEKLLATVLAKLSNFVPEAGIWLNTQRPEWNDANNALVGNGASMVTLYYLRRFLRFFQDLLQQDAASEMEISRELKVFFDRVASTLRAHAHLLDAPFNDQNRKIVTDALGEAGSDYRLLIYEQGFSGERAPIGREEMARCVATALNYLEHSIEANRRPDHLFHSYNLISYAKDTISVSHLSEMLEGQVAALSSGYLTAQESLKLLDALRQSTLYRQDQNSYILYPDNELPGFLEKNNVPASAVQQSELLTTMLQDNDQRIVSRDIGGAIHFNGDFRNASHLKQALRDLENTSYAFLAEKERSYVLEVYESVFNHKAFTGRSGSFFAYEGLGSIYWHMVSKLHLAVAGVCLDAAQHSPSTSEPEHAPNPSTLAPQASNKLHLDDQAQHPSTLDGLLEHVRQIGEGLGIHKEPENYGAFPTDAYSHTPKHRGAQQPGMTGQVKEDILVGLAEFGVQIENGMLGFKPKILTRIQFAQTPERLECVNVHQQTEWVDVPANALCFSMCQVPVVYMLATSDAIQVLLESGETRAIQGLALDEQTSAEVFMRTGAVKKITVLLRECHLH